jgi:hypothetical protein
MVHGSQRGNVTAFPVPDGITSRIGRFDLTWIK